MTRKEP